MEEASSKEQEAFGSQQPEGPGPKAYYTVSEASDMTGISAYTLRYYDKCGFFPNLFRGKNQVRGFSDNDIAWLRLIDALRKSGLSIEGIQYFVRLSLQGDRSLPEQYRILESQETVLEYQLAEIQESLKVLKGEKLIKRLSLDRMDESERIKA